MQASSTQIVDQDAQHLRLSPNPSFDQKVKLADYINNLRKTQNPLLFQITSLYPLSSICQRSYVYTFKSQYEWSTKTTSELIQLMVELYGSSLLACHFCLVDTTVTLSVLLRYLRPCIYPIPQYDTTVHLPSWFAPNISMQDQPPIFIHSYGLPLTAQLVYNHTSKFLFSPSDRKLQDSTFVYVQPKLTELVTVVPFAHDDSQELQSSVPKKEKKEKKIEKADKPSVKKLNTQPSLQSFFKPKPKIEQKPC